MGSENIINCNGIPYRQGFIQVQPNVHSGFVNLEAWNIDPEVNLKGISMNSSTIRDCDFTGNVELELDLKTAKTLAEILYQAVAKIERNTA